MIYNLFQYFTIFFINTTEYREALEESETLTRERLKISKLNGTKAKLK